jgi:replication-associated recombination protein RarA
VVWRAAPDALPAHWLQRLAQAADGDARKALVLLETVYELARAEGTTDDAVLVKFLGKGLGVLINKANNFTTKSPLCINRCVVLILMPPCIGLHVC